MGKRIINELHRLIEDRNLEYVQGNLRKGKKQTVEERTKKMHKKRGAEIVRSFVEGDFVRTQRVGDEQFIDYYLKNEKLIKLQDSIYLEESIEYKRAQFKKDRFIKEEDLFPFAASEDNDKDGELSKEDIRLDKEEERTVYNRHEAVRYAERWWDDYNPVYQRFTDNCTNFISQCLRAGGAPMTGYPNREKGWWYQGSKWSLSWAVAHSMRWHLSSAKTGLQGMEVSRASELQPGDVICYDFDGDGRWQHTTIVVALDANNEPLVNAQTSNSRMRYWTYEDSTAWTPNIQYKFFRIFVQ